MLVAFLATNGVPWLLYAICEVLAMLENALFWETECPIQVRCYLWRPRHIGNCFILGNWV